MNVINFHVINLAEREDRWNSLLERFSDVCASDEKTVGGWCNFIRVDAIKNTEKPYMGVSMSHLKAIELHTDDPIHIVLEDDIAKTEHWSKESILEMISFLRLHLSEWDVFTDGNIYLNGCYDYHHPQLIIPVTFASIQFCIYNTTSERIRNIRSLYERTISNHRGPSVGPKCFDTFLAQSELKVISHIPYWSYQVAGYSSLAKTYMDYTSDYYRGNSYLLAQKFLMKYRKRELHKYFSKYKIDRNYIIGCFSNQIGSSFSMPPFIHIKRNLYIDTITNQFVIRDE